MPPRTPADHLAPWGRRNTHENASVGSFAYPVPVSGYPVSAPVKGRERIYFVGNQNPNNPLQWMFQDKSEIELTTDWHWDMGDGTTYDFTNDDPFSHTFSMSGLWTVRMDLYNGAQMIGTATQQILIQTALALTDKNGLALTDKNGLAITGPMG